MSMKQGWGLDRFPMQDEHENGGQVGMLRPGAGAHAECREPESRANTGVPAVQPQDRICGLPTSGSLRVGRAHFGSTRVWKFEQDRARTDPCLRGEGNGVERLANDPPNPKIPGYGRGAGATVPAAPICHSVHGAGHRIVGGSRPRPRALERASDTVHFAARVRAVWADVVCPAGAYFGGPSVQPASQCTVWQSGSGVPANPAHPDHDWGTAQTRSARPARVSARGHGTSRRLGRRQGGVSHQRRRYGDAVAGSGLRQQDQRKLLVACTEAMLEQFPFVVLGFHADNGSEFINHTVAKLLDKLRAEFTKSRPNRSQDNALVEGKNGSVIRKLIGYGHIPTEHAEALQKFYAQFLNPYLNFHRPCGFATVTEDPRGKRRRRYPVENYQTPYERLKSLPEATRYLRPGLSWARLDPIADERSDTEWARQMQTAKARLLRQCKWQYPVPPTFC